VREIHVTAPGEGEEPVDPDGDLIELSQNG